MTTVTFTPIISTGPRAQTVQGTKTPGLTCGAPKLQWLLAQLYFFERGGRERGKKEGFLGLYNQ